MKQIIKYIILVSLVSLGVNASSEKWVPILMGDITMFVPYVNADDILHIKTNKSTYVTDEIVSVTINRPLSGDRDWVGIYHKGASNDGSNVLAWNWVGQGTTQISKIIRSMPAGEYEIRLYFHNSYNIVERYSFTVINNNPYIYGEMGNSEIQVSAYSQDARAVIYHPSTWNNTPTPIIFYTPGWKSTNHNSYRTLLRFIASHGYSVVYVPDSGSYVSQLQKFDDIVAEFSNKLDTTKIGTLGFSSGGGFVFKLLEHMNDQEYGTNGRFLCSMDGYFAQFMDKENMNNLDFTNILFIKFAPSGGNTDPRIVLTNYNLLTGEGIDKNYIVLANVNDHGYPTRQDINIMQGLLKPLDGLMEYTFKEKLDAHHAIALEGPGKINPYLNAYEKVLPKNNYNYNCDYANGWHKGTDGNTQSTINNCGEPEIQPN